MPLIPPTSGGRRPSGRRPFAILSPGERRRGDGRSCRSTASSPRTAAHLSGDRALGRDRATPDDAGTFAASLALRDGANAIGLTLLSGKDVIARSAYTVILDRQPPTLDMIGPVDGATVDGPNVIVQGKAEIGATVTVNGRTIVPGQDGSFSESFTPPVGPVAITVVARDRAGNETTKKSSVTLRAPIAAATLVTVTLDRAKVRPGEIVSAQIRVTENGIPKVGTLATLSVGVITIGSAATDVFGNTRIAFAAPPNEGD